MTTFRKQFLAEESRGRKRAPVRDVYVGAFGKHPGWTDFMGDLGLETESLVLTKRILYIEGIGGQISSGAWEKVPAEQRLDEFNHLFLWRRGGQCLIGCLFASSDRTGSKQFPMGIVVQCVGLPLAWIAREIPRRLEQWQTACVATSSADEVRQIIARAHEDLGREILLLTEHDPGPVLDSAVRDRFLTAPEWGVGQVGLHRVLHLMNGQMSAFIQRPGARTATDLGELRAQQMRVPRIAESPFEGMLLWSELLALRLDQDVPVLYIAPVSHPWIDVTVGRPAARDFFCLRASAEAIPLVTAVPYNLGPDVVRQADGVTAAFLSGEAAPKDSSVGKQSRNAETEAQGRVSRQKTPSPGRRFSRRRVLASGAGLVLVGGLAWTVSYWVDKPKSPRIEWVGQLPPAALEVGQESPVLNFHVWDAETPPDRLKVTADSSNPALVPRQAIALGGAGSDRTLKLRPAAGQTGTAQITLSVVNDRGSAAATNFGLSVQPKSRPPAPTGVSSMSSTQEVQSPKTERNSP